MPAFVALARNAVLSANLRPHVQPVDDKADVKTAEVISALIRNTEHLSQVEAVYDAYADRAGGKSLISGADLPEWRDLPADIRAAWSAAAGAVVRRCREQGRAGW